MELAAVAWGTVCGVAVALTIGCVTWYLRRRFCPPLPLPAEVGDGSTHRLPAPLSSAASAAAPAPAPAPARLTQGVWDHHPGSSDSLDSADSPALPTRSLRRGLQPSALSLSDPPGGAHTALSLMQADKRAAKVAAEGGGGQQAGTAGGEPAALALGEPAAAPAAGELALRVRSRSEAAGGEAAPPGDRRP